MSFDADVTACAQLVERGDPWRFRAVMAAPARARPLLFALFAFNVEVSRAPWVTQEPMIAEMRLQWWRDVCDEIASGGPVRRHEVASPLARLIRPEDAALLDELVAARRWDIYKDAFEDEAHFATYLDQTAGHLTWVAARTLGEADETTVRAVAQAAGIAGWLRAIPALEAQGRVPLLDGTPEGVRALARKGLARLQEARSNRRAVSRPSRAALYHIGGALPVLQAAANDPRLVAEGGLPDPVAADRNLIWRVLTGRW